jgi:hypothetical protein
MLDPALVAELTAWANPSSPAARLRLSGERTCADTCGAAVVALRAADERANAAEAVAIYQRGRADRRR